jgi:DNA-binding FadR family transcriptional regulator
MADIVHLPRTTFQAQVQAELGRDICAGRFQPGDILPPEADLCERFNLSRIVIREAVKGLAAKGMVDVRRKVGTQVQELAHWNLFDPDIIAWRTQTVGVDRTMSRDLLELRRVVEPATARLAARRASAEQRAALRAAYQAMVRAVAGEGDYVSADLAFHTTIMRAAGNQFLGQMQSAMGALLHATFQIVSRKPGGPAHSLPMHDMLCNAIERGDEADAEQATLRLIEQSERDLIEQLQL